MHELPEFESKYMVIERDGGTTKTHRLSVKSKSQGDTLGVIKWYGPWRGYCFYPSYGTIFSVGCLIDLVSYIEKLMECWRIGH